MAVLQRAYFQGHTYLLLDHPDASKWWAQDEAEAVSLGGHLATVNWAAEDAFIFSSFANTVQTTAASLGQATNHTWIFIGLTDQATEGVRVWSSGDRLAFTNFPGQPNPQDVSSIRTSSPSSRRRLSRFLEYVYSRRLVHARQQFRPIRRPLLRRRRAAAAARHGCGGNLSSPAPQAPTLSGRSAAPIR